MTPYQVLLLIILILWPIAIAGVLFLMSKLEEYVRRPDVDRPEEAGVEPTRGRPPEKEVKVVFGGKVVGSPPAEEQALDTVARG